MIWPLTFWYVMACWEVYDMHPDHLFVYSVLVFGAIVRKVSSTSPPIRKKEPR